MTNFRQVQGNKRRAGNIKEGRGTCQSVKITGFWGVEGFTPTRPVGTWTYHQRGLINGPTFNVIEGEEITATLDGEISESETFGPDDHTDVKAWMDDQIFGLMQLDWQPTNEEIDIDDFMSGRWVRS
jgi:hypothetical protein